MSKEEKAKEYADNTIGNYDYAGLNKLEAISELSDAYLAGYTAAEQDLSSQLTAYKEALRELVYQIDEIGVNRAVDYANGSRYYRCMIRDESYDKAKTLIDPDDELEMCENCEKYFHMDAMIHDREGVALCPECFDEIKDDPEFLIKDDEDL